ncbi:hypothetical protein Unana1_03132 [Umbelopsis nana]
MGDHRPFKRAYSDIETMTSDPKPLHNGSSAMTSLAKNQLILAYFKFRHEVFSILPRKQLLRDGIDSDPFVSPLLQNSIFAHAADHAGRESKVSGTPTSGASFYAKATYMVAGYLEQSRISTIAALCLISLYYDDQQSSLSKSWIYSGMAFRMAIDIGFNTPSETDVDRHNLELRKRVLWGCYVLDKVQSLMSGKQWMITGHSIELDYPLPLADENTLDHAVLDGFVALIRLMQICERVLHFEFFIAPHSKEHEQASLDLSNELLNWLRMLPAHLQWTPLPQAASDATLQAPSSAMIANLHLCYNIVEMRVLQPYAMAPGNKAIRTRCYAVASSIVQLIDFVYEDPTIVVTPYLIVHAAERSAQFSAYELKNMDRAANGQAKPLFVRVMTALKHLHKTFNMPEAGLAISKLEASLAQTARYNDTAPVDAQADLALANNEVINNLSQLQSPGSNVPMKNVGKLQSTPQELAKRDQPVQSNENSRRTLNQVAFQYQNGDLVQDHRPEAIIHGLRDGTDPVFTPQSQFVSNRVDTFSFDSLQVDATDQAQWDVQPIPANDPVVNGPVKLHNYDYYLNAQNLPRRIRLFTPYPTYNVPQPTVRPTMSEPSLVSDNMQTSPSSLPSHTTAQSQNYPLSLSIDSLDHHTAGQLLSMETAISQQSTWDPQNKWYQHLNMDPDTPTATSRDDLQRQQANSEPPQPAHKQSYRGIGLGMYASAHRHHTDVIRQQTPLDEVNQTDVHQNQIELTPPEPYQAPTEEPLKHDDHVIDPHRHVQFSTQATA